MWSKSPAIFEELVTRGMHRRDGYLQGCADKLSKSPPPSCSCIMKCISGGKMMYNRDEEHKLFSKRFGSRCECSVLGWRGRITVGSE